MNREQAEKLLAALIFDDLDETSKTELTAYLQTDDELRYRLADLRMAVKLTDDAVNEGPDPVLGEQRLKQLKRLAKANKINIWTLPISRPLAVAAVLIFALLLIGLLMPSLSKTRRYDATTASKTRSLAQLLPADKDGDSIALAEVPAPPPASRPASRSPLAVTTAPAIRNSPVATQPDGDGVYNMAFTGPEGRVGDTGGMGGMGMGGRASDRKDNYATSAYGGGMRGRGNVDPAITSLGTGFEGLDTRFEGGTSVQIGKGSVSRQVAASDAPATSQPDLGSLRSLSPSEALRSLGRRSKSKEVQPPTETPTAPSGGVYAGVKILDQQAAASEERVREELGELRSSSPGGAPKAWPVETIRGPKVEVTELDVAKDAAGKSVAAESEPAMRLGRAASDKEIIYQSSRGNRAAEPPAKTDVVSIAGAAGNGAVVYDRQVPYGWKGEITPQQPAAPVPTPAPSEQMLDNISVTVAEPDPAASLARTPGESDIAYRTRVAQVRNQQAALRAQQQVARAQLGQETKPGVYLDADSLAAVNKKLDQLSEVAAAARSDQRVPLMGDVPLVGELFQKGVQPTANAEAPGQAIGEVTYPAPSVQVQDEQGKLDLRVVDSLAKVQNELNIAEGRLRGQTLAEDKAPLASSSHFKVVPVNPWVMTDQDALSTFALDVDTASYALCRRLIRGGYLPPIGAVRMEEFINAFDYAYPQRDDQPFTVYAEGTPSPFAPVGQDLTLLKVAVKARTVGRDQRRAANLVFVVDASASMGQADRLPLVQAAANQLVDKLAEADHVSLITCANDARLHLEAVPARQKDAIHETINAIQPAGPTNLLAGLKLAYAMARKNFVAGQTNEVVLCSDGVANVGQTEAEAMLQEVAQDRKQAITLTCVGVGYGAYNDAFLEALANQGDGRYVFLDSSEQAQQALVGQLAASLENVASDARIQVQFNPNRVRRYRLIGYENRDIEDKRFRDDTVDAGAVGSGQCSTALYELELTVPSSGEGQGDLGTVFVRYRNVENGQMEEISRPLADSIVRRRSVEEDPRFFLAAGAARFAEWLRQSEHAQNTALPDVQRVLDQVSAALPLDRDVQGLAALAHQAEGLPRAPEAATP